jgi:hypothetical protein
MHHRNKIVVTLFLISFLLAGVAATRPDEDPPNKNLKILPKNISHEDLDKVMDGFKAALGVKCNYCHAPFKDSSLRKLDFASDEKPEKNIARRMMRMAGKINKKYFSFNKNEKGETVAAVTCITCHRGNPHPEPE